MMEGSLLRRAYRHSGESITHIGYGGHPIAILIGGRYVRWRCTYHHCPDVQRLKPIGKHTYHVFDIQTGEAWTEDETPRQGGQRAA
jgi:hypothetical protein